jgi:hypothetical protein
MTPDPAAVPMTDIHDIKPLLEIAAAPAGWRIALAVAALAALLVLGRWLWRRRRREGRHQTAAFLLSPAAEAYRQLDGLAAEEPADVKLAYFRLSAIIRRYIARRFGVPAAEMTTEELLPALDRLPLAGDLAQALTAFCRAADPIKFAGVSVDRERLPRDLAFARDFVRRTSDGPGASGQVQPAPPTMAAHARIE